LGGGGIFVFPMCRLENVFYVLLSFSFLRSCLRG
jgi:hypothetical protein